MPPGRKKATRKRSAPKTKKKAKARKEPTPTYRGGGKGPGVGPAEQHVVPTPALLTVSNQIDDLKKHLMAIEQILIEKL
jgi:hypothetical protein